MTSLERVLATLAFKEPDRVPFFLPLTMHGAKELGLGIREYFACAETVVEGQMRLRARYQHDCLVGFLYGAVDAEAFGGEVIYVDDGPPNSGAPVIRSMETILALQPPEVARTPCLQKVLQTIAGLKARVGNEAPIIGVVISPFSLPVMQLGFERYLDLLYDRRDLFARLMAVNQAFCVAWANAQLAAGATAIVYFDPVSSPTCIPPALYRETGLVVARRTLGEIKGPTAIHLASGRCQAIVEDLAQTGTAAIGVSALDDLATVKSACRGCISVIGNLNGIAMRSWTAAEAERQVRAAVAAAAAGGGFILADNHGEIPFQVPDDVLHALSESVQRWGVYPP